MRYTKMVLSILVAVLLLTGSAMANHKWVRVEAPYTVKEVQMNAQTPSIQDKNGSTEWKIALLPDSIQVNPLIDPPELPGLVLTRGESLGEILKRIRPSAMTDNEFNYMCQEVIFLNKNKMLKDKTFIPGSKLTLPLYKTMNGYACSDMRNIMVAVMKGRKYNVHWAYLIGVRTQENPSPRRDHYAYGVVCKKGTNLWTQAEWGAKILKRCTGKAAANPSYAAMDRASHTYVGYETSEWPRNVYAVYKRCQGLN